MAFIAEKKPDVVFLPHGNDTNSAHRAMHAMVRRIAQQSSRPLTVLLNRDPKTIDMRTDLYMPFDQAPAEWKAQLLRFHDTQQQRNLHARGHGFDERVLEVNKLFALTLPLDASYAEAFEAEQHPLERA